MYIFHPWCSMNIWSYWTVCLKLLKHKRYSLLTKYVYTYNLDERGTRGKHYWSLTGRRTWPQNASSRWMPPKPPSPTWRYFIILPWEENSVHAGCDSGSIRCLTPVYSMLCSPKIPDGIGADSTRDRTKTFTYDFSYDSTDCKSSSFVSQEKVNGAFLKTGRSFTVVFMILRSSFLFFRLAGFQRPGLRRAAGGVRGLQRLRLRLRSDRLGEVLHHDGKSSETKHH